MSSPFDEFQRAPQAASPADPFDQFQRVNPPVRSTLEVAQRFKPDAVAEAARLAARYPAPFETAYRQLDTLRAHDLLNNTEALLAQAPALRRYMETNFPGAAMAQDDVGTLAKLERFAGNVGSSIKAGVFRASRGVAGTMQAGLELAAPVLDPLEPLDPTATSPGLLPRVPFPGGNPLRRLAEGFAAVGGTAGAVAKAATPKTDSDVEAGFFSGIQSLTQNLLSLPMAFAPGGQGAALASMTSMTGGDAYQTAREKGLSMGQALPFAASQAAIEYATEKLPLGALLKDVKAGAGFLQVLGRQVALEIPGEQIATVLQDLNEWAILNPDKPFSSYLEERPSAAVQTLVATVVGAGGNVAVAKGLEAVVSRAARDGANMQRAGVLNKALEDAFTEAEASLLRQRSPEEFRVLMQSVTDGQVWVDAEVLNQLPAAVLEQMPTVAAELDGAMATGAPVAVPVADALTLLAGTPSAEVFMQNARVAPDAPSFAEAETASKQAGEYLQQKAAEVIQQAQDQEAARASQEAVKANVKSQLQATGRFSEAVVDGYASWASAFYTAYGSRLGMTPEQFYQRYPLRVLGAETAPAPAYADAGQRTAGRLDNIEAYHWSAQARPVLSTAFYGTGLRGSARDEIMSDPDPRVRQRLSFYVDKGTGVRPESGVGGVAHRVNLSNIYDANEDPLKLRGGSARDFEKRVLDAGFSGYLDRLDGTQPGQVILLGDQTLQPEVLGPLSRVEGGQRVPALARREAPWQVQASGTPEQLQARLERMQGNPSWADRYDMKVGGNQLLIREKGGVFEQSVSTRLPTAKKATENPLEAMLVIGLEAAKADPKAFEKNVELIRQYPNFRDNKSASAPDKAAEQFIRHVVDNLLWLYDQVPAPTRERSKLWYDGARAIADRWTAKYGVTDAQVSGMLAVLSPQKDWFQNVSLAERVLDAMSTKQDFAWSDEMSQTAAGIPALNVEDVGEITGKTLGELEGSDYLQAVWIRVYDQTYNERGYRVVTPEGDFGSWVLNTDGKTRSKTAWGSFNEIGKAVSVFKDGSIANISASLGEQHKVRNFYNNIFNPASPHGDVTIDTHAVAAGLLRPLSGSATEVLHNFGAGGAASSSVFGSKGTYGIYAEAYRRAAAERGVLPREMQSITWEAVRGLYTAGFKSQDANVKAIDAVWNQYKQRKLSLDDTRNQLLELSGGIAPPEWERPGAGAPETAWASSYSSELREGGGAEGALGGGAGVPGGGSTGVLEQPANDAGQQRQEGGLTDGNRTGRDQGGSLAPLEGAPVIQGATGPDPRLVAVAEQYARSIGIELRRQGEYVQVDPERAARIAAAYDAMEHAPNDPKVREAYDDLARQTMAQYQALEAAGYRFYLVDETNDPYGGNPWSAMRDLRANQTMGVFATEAGFGTSEFDPAGNPLLADTGLEWGYGSPDGPKKRVLFNDLFRAVHDAFGHGLEGAGFRAQGEENAWQAHVRLFTGPAVGAITSETRGQNSWLNYGPHGEKNRTAKVEDTVFADQKTGLMPEWTWAEGRAADMAQQTQSLPRTLVNRRTGATIVVGDTVQTTNGKAVQVLEIMPATGEVRLSGFAGGLVRPVRTIMAEFRDTLEQQGPRPRGTFSPSTLELVLNPDADLSTFFHETGHFFLEVLADVASQPDAPAQIVEDMNTFLKWAGVKDLETWNAMTLDQKRPYHERWAESTEQYVMEGRVPNAELQPLMRRFATWLKSVYGSIKAFVAGRPDAQLNDDIRRVMDRMLATDEQIAQANEEAGLAPDAEADAQAAERLNKRSMADLKWAVRARDKVIAKLRKQAKEIEKGIRAEVTLEVDSTPEMRAAAALAEAEKAYEADPVAADFNAAAIADSFGFAGVDAMYKAIERYGPRQEAIDGITERRMLEEHGDLVDERAIAEAANAAVHNEARARSLATELRTQAEMLNAREDTGETNARGARITVNTLVEAAKQFGRAVADRTLVRDLKSKAWAHTAAERRASTRWQQATAKGETQEAVKAKQDQTLNHAAARALGEAQDEVRKIREFFARVTKGNDETVVEKGRDPDIVNAARAILAEYGVQTPTTKRAAEYLELVKTNDPETAGAIEPMVAAATANAQPLEALNLAELRELHETIDALWHLAKRSRQMEVDGKLLDRQELADDLFARMEEIGIPDKVPGEGGAVTKAEARALFLRQGISFLRRVEQWAEGMDGKYGGPFLRYVFQPVKAAADRYRTDRVAYRKRFQALLDNVAPIVGDQVIEAPELGYTFGAPGSTRGVAMNEILHAIAHTGNESNKRKLLLGRGWAVETPDGELDTSRWDAFIRRLVAEGKLQQAHFDFVQGIWDLLEDTKPLAQAAHRDAFGRFFNEVTADAFVDPFGVQRRGGYVPAMVDPDLVKDNELKKLAEDENSSMAFAFPQPAKGFTMSRVEGYTRPLMLDLRSLSQHLDKVLLFSHMTVPARDVRKLLTDKKVSQPLTRIDPSAVSGMLQPWLQRSAQQVVETPIVGVGKWARIPSIIRARAGAALMFANVSNAIQQVTGLVTATVKVKPAFLMRAMAQHVAHPVKMAQAVWEASPYMNDRAKNEVAIMNEQMTEALLKPSVYEKAQNWSMRHAYFLQTALDNALSPIVWTGAYNQGMAEGMTHDEAVRFADGTVRQTQGSTLPEDVSRFETGPAYARIFTQFVGYFNMVANTNATALQQIAGEVGLKKGAGRAFSVVMLGLMAPLWIAEAIALAFKGGPDDEDQDGYLDDWLASVFGFGTAKGLLAMIPIAGQAGMAVVNRMDTNPVNDRVSLSPGVSMIESALGGNAQTVVELLDENKDINDRRAVRDAATLVSIFTGLPLYAVARPAGYLAGVAEGRIEPQGPVDFTRGLVTGTPSPESKQ